MAYRRFCLAGAMAFVLPGAALAQAQTPVQPAPAQPPAGAGDAAQAAPAKPPAKPPAPATAKAAAPAVKTVDTITVTGLVPDEKSTIDTKSYTLSKDLLATTGSVADALRNVPAVEVDPQGTLSLRGDSNVTILVDGKPSPMFEGVGRADALQQLPADQIERVEVITNPSAALNPEGTGGVINLITKKSRGAGVTGSAYVTAASGGLKRSGASFGYNSAKLAVTAALSSNYQRNKVHVDDARAGFDATSGQFIKSDDLDTGRNLVRGPTARLSVTYTPEDKDQFTGGVTYNSLLRQGHPFDRFETDGLDGAPVSIIGRLGERRFLETDNSFSGGWKHTFGDGHELSVNTVYNDSLTRDHVVYATTPILPPTAIPLELQRGDESDHHAELTVSYIRPLAGGSLNAGYEVRREDNDFNYADSMGPTAASLAPQANLANHYLFEQLVNSIYVTYHRSLGDLDLQAGLRGEDVNFTLAQLTSGERDSQHYERAYPS